MPLTAAAFWLVYAGGLVGALFNPIIGLALYILVYHINPETQWWGSSFAAVGLRGSFMVALATMIGLLIRHPRMEHGARQFPLPYLLALLFTAIAIGSLAWGVDITERGLYYAEKIAKLMVFLFLLIRCVRTPQHYQIVIVSWLIGVAYLGYEARGGAGTMIGGRLSEGLGGPDFAESSDLAVHLVATLPLIGAMFFMSRSWWGRLFALATGALAVDTLVMTRTRNALAGLALITVACACALPRRYRLKGLAGIVIGLFLAAQLADPAWWHRMQTVADYQQDASAIGRLTFWKAGFAMALDYPLGIGLGNFHHLVMEYVPGLDIIRSAHNTIVACVAELGWPGLFVFLAIFSVSIVRLGRVRRTAVSLPDFADIRIGRWQTRFHLGWHAVALRAALIGYLGCGLFTTRLYSEDFWMLLGLGMCLHNVSRYMVGEQRLESQPAPASAVPAADPLPAAAQPAHG